MKIVFVNRFFAPDHSATSQMLTDLAVALAAQGNEVHVVTSRLLYDDPSARLTAREAIEGVSVHRVRTSRFGRIGLAGRAIDCLSFYLFAFAALLRLLRAGDILVAKTDPPLVSVPAYWVARARGAHLVNWLQDLFPEAAAEVDIRLGRGPVGWLLRLARNGSLRGAAANVVLGRSMRARVLATGADPGKVTIIPNWADGDALQPLERQANPLRAAWRLDGKFVVGYSGNLGRVHEFETMLGAARALRDRDDIVFMFIGGGVRMGALQAAVRSEKLANVRFMPYQPRKLLGLSLCTADVHLVSLRTRLEGLCVPSKIYGIAAAGRPAIFVGDPTGEVAAFVRSAQCGYCVPEGDAAALAASIVELAGDPVRQAKMGQAARRAFDEHYDQRIALSKWQRVLESAGQVELPREQPVRVQTS